jgi:hypothetical protein
MTSIDKVAVTEELKQIVTDFNSKFADWMEAHGCRAEFAWRYGSDRTQVKSLDIQAVDLIVFRKPAPAFERMQEALGTPV